MKGKKGTFVLLMFSILLSVLIVPGSAQTVMGRVSIGDMSAQPGGVVTTAITISDVTNLGVAEINLRYDSSVVHVLTVSNGDFDTGAISNVDNSAGVARIGAFQMQSEGLNGEVKLCEVELKAVGVAGASSKLKIEILELKDATPQGNEIPASGEEGLFTITMAGAAQTSSPTPTPSPTPITPELQKELGKSEETTEFPIVITTSKGGLAELTDYLDSKGIPYDILTTPNMVGCNATAPVIQELSQKSFVRRIERDIEVSAQIPAPTGTPIMSPAAPAETPIETPIPTKTPIIPGFEVLYVMISILIVYFIFVRGVR